MSRRFMLDTDTCSFLIRGGGERLQSQVRSHAGSLCVSAVTAAELRYGALKKGSSRIVESVAFLLDLLPAVPWGGSAPERYAEIRVALEAAGTPIGHMDMLIAASALAEDCVVVSHSMAHFTRVPGLVVEDWSSPQKIF